MKKCGFTLAEVLITLGIIGVVAALTLPTLINQYKKTEVSSRLKKFYSMMEQAIRMSELDNGDVTTWTRNRYVFGSNGIDYETTGQYSKEFFIKYLGPYFKYNKIVEGTNILDDDGNLTGNGTNTEVYLADGSKFAIHNGGCMDINFDINGEGKPNDAGKDIFVFAFCTDENERIARCGSAKKVFCPLSQNLNVDNSREKLLQDCKNAAGFCAALLFRDNWEFKDDYPYKL